MIFQAWIGIRRRRFRPASASNKRAVCKMDSNRSPRPTASNHPFFLLIHLQIDILQVFISSFSVFFFPFIISFFSPFSSVLALGFCSKLGGSSPHLAPRSEPAVPLPMVFEPVAHLGGGESGGLGQVPILGRIWVRVLQVPLPQQLLDLFLEWVKKRQLLIIVSRVNWVAERRQSL